MSSRKAPKAPQSPALAKWWAEHPEKRAEFTARGGRKRRTTPTPFPREGTHSEQILWFRNEFLRKYEQTGNVGALKSALTTTLKIGASPDAEEQAYAAFLTKQIAKREKMSSENN